MNRSEDAVLSDTVTAIWSGTGFERTGRKTPRERHCGRKDAPKRLFISRVDESQPLESYLSEKVGGKRERGDSPFHGARQETCTEEGHCTAGALFVVGRYGRSVR